MIAQNLDIGYQGEVIVPEVNFELTCGQSLALVGINGSGKTTLLKTIVGLLPPIKGEITCAGQPTREKSPPAGLPEPVPRIRLHPAVAGKGCGADGALYR